MVRRIFIGANKARVQFWEAQRAEGIYRAADGRKREGYIQSSMGEMRGRSVPRCRHVHGSTVMLEKKKEKNTFRND